MLGIVMAGFLIVRALQFLRYNSTHDRMIFPANIVSVVQRGVNITLFAPAARRRSPGCCLSQVLFHWSPCICV